MPNKLKVYFEDRMNRRFDNVEVVIGKDESKREACIRINREGVFIHGDDLETYKYIPSHHILEIEYKA